MPSEIVISRLIGGGPEAVWRRVAGRRVFSSSIRSRGWRTGRLSNRPRGWSTGGGARPGPSGPRGVVGCCGRGPGTARRRAGARPLPGHHGLAGADRPAVNRLTGRGRALRAGHSRTRHCGRCRHRRTRRIQFRSQVGTRWHHRASRRLARQGPRRGARDRATPSFGRRLAAAEPAAKTAADRLASDAPSPPVLRASAREGRTESGQAGGRCGARYRSHRQRRRSSRGDYRNRWCWRWWHRRSCRRGRRLPRHRDWRMDRPSRSQRRTDRCAAGDRADFAGQRRRLCQCFSRLRGSFRRSHFGARLHCLRRGFLRRRFRRKFQARNLMAQQAAQLDRYVFIDGAGVRLLFGNAQFGQPVQDLVGLDFELPCQLVDSNLFHRKSNRRLPLKTHLNRHDSPGRPLRHRRGRL